MPITFVPPPLENATYSVGVYEVKSGKLARRLCEAAGQDTFKIGLNGLITSWDGRDDDGKPLPPGKYAARGYAVGSMDVEGVAIHGNDWINDDASLRIMRVDAIALIPEDDGLALTADNADRHKVVLRYSGKDGTLVWKKVIPDGFDGDGFGINKNWDLAIEDGIVFTTNHYRSNQYRVSDGADVVPLKRPSASLFKTQRAASRGKDNTIWMTDGRELIHLQAEAAADDKIPKLPLDENLLTKVIRRLPERAGEPRPIAVSASRAQDKIYVDEGLGGWMRVRGLSWVATTEENGKLVSTWKTFFERNIWLADPALGLQDALRANQAVVSVEITLEENRLAPGKREQLKLTASCDEKGSYLSTVDGLRLRQISQREHLTVVRLAKGKTPKELAFFQTDLAAWDEFSIGGFGKIATFDAGEFEIDAAGEKPVTEKAPEPDL